MGLPCIISFALIAAVTFTTIIESCHGLGYSPYYGGGGYYGGGYGGYGTCSSYPSYSYCNSYPCLKTKLIKKYLELKRPCYKKPCLPCLHKPRLPCLSYYQKPCLPCLACRKPCLPCQSPSACFNTATVFKYPACGPCPYASFQPKCLKHKATLALCS
ncbi:hypothetical protein GE061_006099 [Apolygus lucorum]|uniref:Uncharacterized protein n=1 Tax=Apolygus lucorum TaxID=248454 RepID=A0A6A4JAK2_APOLU|nr:hypothetical protein GE061_006099 [Apolygus lucorum]